MCGQRGGTGARAALRRDAGHSGHFLFIGKSSACSSGYGTRPDSAGSARAAAGCTNGLCITRNRALTAAPPTPPVGGSTAGSGGTRRGRRDCPQNLWTSLWSHSGPFAPRGHWRRPAARWSNSVQPVTTPKNSYLQVCARWFAQCAAGDGSRPARVHNHERPRPTPVDAPAAGPVARLARMAATGAWPVAARRRPVVDNSVDRSGGPRPQSRRGPGCAAGIGGSSRAHQALANTWRGTRPEAPGTRPGDRLCTKHACRVVARDPGAGRTGRARSGGGRPMTRK